MTLDNHSYENTHADWSHIGVGVGDQRAADLSRATWDNLAGVCRQPKIENSIHKDQFGRVTEVIHPDGSIYDYSQFRPNGQPSEIRITDSKTGNWGQWKREDEGLWRSYDKDKPNYEVVRGEWVVDNKGVMHMLGVQDTTELPKHKSAPVDDNIPSYHSSAGEIPHRHTNVGHIGPGPEGLPKGPPEGYKYLISKEVVAEANSLLGGAYGTVTPFEANGKRYMARVEPHYHPPGFQGGPNGWHKGVTVYEAK